MLRILFLILVMISCGKPKKEELSLNPSCIYGGEDIKENKFPVDETKIETKNFVNSFNKKFHENLFQSIY